MNYFYVWEENFTQQILTTELKLNMFSIKTFFFFYLETKWHFGAKSSVFECKNFPNEYFSTSILRFSAGIRLSRTADGGLRAGLIFDF